MATVAQQIQRPAVEGVFLLEITAGLLCAAWVLSSGKTITYQVATALNITGATMNGAALTAQVSVANVEANPGSWYWDGSNIYVSAATGTPFGQTTIATVQMYFGSEPKIFNNQYYQPLIVSVPSLSIRIDEIFSGIGQVNAGQAVLNNAGHYFDGLDSLVWDNGRCVVKYGVDTALDVMVYANYQTIGTWLIIQRSSGDTTFTLTLADLRTRLVSTIPKEVYTLAAYPNLASGDVGKPLQRAYGRIYGANPVCINPGASTPVSCTITSGGGYATVSQTAHGYSTGQWVLVTGATQTQYNIPALVTVIDANTWYYPITGSPASPATGSPGVSLQVAQFKVANHAIWQFVTVRLKLNDIWVQSAFATTDLSTGQFTLGADYVAGTDVAVDFVGMKNANGTPMLNAADQVSDLLAYIGETNQNTAAFLVAHNRLDIGVDNYGQRVVVRAPFAYIDSSVDALQILQNINDLVGSYLFPDANGQWKYIVFEPSPGELLQTFTENDMIGDMVLEKDPTEVDTSLAINYAPRTQDGYTPIQTVTSVANQYRHGLPSPVLDTIDLAASEQKDALYYGQRFLLSDGLPRKRVNITVPWQSFLLLPGDQIHVTDTRRGFDEIMEVVSTSQDLTGGNSALVLGYQRQWGRRAGHWVEGWQACLAFTTGIASRLCESTLEDSLYDNLTVEALVKVSAYPTFGSGIGHIVGSGQFSLDMNSSGVIIASGEWWTLTGISSIPLNTWTHVAMTVSSTSGVSSIYINGVLDKAGSVSSPSTAGPDFVTVGSLRFGLSIGETRVWNYVRSQSQIQSAMGMSISAYTVGIVNLWRFIDGTGTTVIDSSFGRNNLTYGGVGISWSTSAQVAVLPSRFSTLAGYGSGSLTWNINWDPTIKTWAVQNVGYWTDANGFANSSDPASYQPSTWL